MWLDHDGRWFLQVAAHHGFAHANDLNRAAATSVAKAGMRKLRAVLGDAEIRSLEHLKELMEVAYDLYYDPASCQVSFAIVGPRHLRATYAKCPVLDRVARGGGIENYVCGCPYAYEGWLQAWGIDGSVRIERSVRDGASQCEVLIELSEEIGSSDLRG